MVSSESIDALLGLAPQNPVEQADRLLINLALKSSEPGVFTALTSYGHTGYAFADSIDAFVTWLHFLQEEGFIEYKGARHDKANDLCFRLKLAGWRRVRELERIGAHSDAAFVAMPFRNEFDALWRQGISPALDEAGWRGVRADREHHNDRIDDWIMNQIRAARFVVVDTTSNNAGACFEAGYALGLGKPVVWVARRDVVKQGLHFDIRQYNHVGWEQGRETELVPELAERIRNTVGQGPAPSRPLSQVSAGRA